MLIVSQNFQEQFGERSPGGKGYFFSNVRSGLIVAMVSQRGALSSPETTG